MQRKSKTFRGVPFRPNPVRGYKIEIPIFEATGPLRQDTGPPRSGAGVGVRILRGTIMFEDLKDSRI